MKKIVSLMVILTMVLTMVSACADASGASKEGDADKRVFTEKDGIFEALDTSDDVPVDGAGFKIEVKKATDGYAKFWITSKDGKATVDYFNFDFKSGEVEKYHYVSMMGVGFYYYYDMAKAELVRLEDDEHADSTQSSKDSGRWASAAEDTAQEIKNIENYFSKTFGSSIKDFVTK